MRKFDLLEKLEIYQIELLIYMSDVGGIATKKELLDHLDIGDYFLSKLIEGLMTSAKKSNGSFSIEVNRHTVRFQTKPDYSIHTLYNELIAHAPKYKILEELLLCGAVDSSRLCEKIGISHSTYFRKINELNTFLNEFDLSIQNGYLLGSELQIRFFYTSFCMVIDPKRHLKVPNVDPRIYETVTNIQTILGGSTSINSRKKLITYLSLLKRRNAQKNIPDYSDQAPFFHNQTDINSQKRFIRALKNTHLFKKINKVLGSFLVYYSFKMIPNETILLLLFMLGEEIIPVNSHYLSELDLIECQSNLFVRTLNEEFSNFMKACHPNTYLNEIHRATFHHYLNSVGYHHLLFKGHIDYYWEPTYIAWEKNKHAEMIYTFIDFFKQKYPLLFVDVTHDSILITRYTHAINFYKDCIRAKLSIGIFIEGDQLCKQKYTNWWIQHIELTTFAQAEPVAFNKLYDLVISNVDCSNLKKRGKYFFFIANYNEKTDINDIDQLLHTIYSSSITKT
ncbi:helix-turn-helix domain-containing protein [Candidatus Enterococcus ikei]|uniref:Helix-turn-helix domain-containing protein n=1 Tax=Candidatus Enterococcus ikei TaxID=2815326 RepID=A0ABS3H2Q6_9ENTE|nr:helix-turn-helix domain-containing protein [Enterococcus sp. DIV0869a]MBO0441810.1 helix-turn-helix domain-containing protein [Enterococcus sp. DIV0869a]